jgi:hypothetical protein
MRSCAVLLLLLLLHTGCAHAAAGDTVDMHLGRTFVKSAPQATVEAAFADMVCVYQHLLHVLAVQLLPQFIAARVQLSACVTVHSMLDQCQCTPLQGHTQRNVLEVLLCYSCICIC